MRHSGVGKEGERPWPGSRMEDSFQGSCTGGCTAAISGNVFYKDTIGSVVSL
jgi:hypothetical protein